MSKNKKKNGFRIAVGLDDSFSSRVWTVVTSGEGDVFIMDRHGREHKITLHKSGECHSAVTSDSWDAISRKFRLSYKSRCNNKWFVDATTLGYVDAFNLVFPYTQLKDRRDEMKPSTKELLRVPFSSAPLSLHGQITHSTIIKFIKATPEAEETNIEKALNINIIKSVKLNCAENLLIGYYHTNELANQLQVLSNRAIAYAAKIPLLYSYDSAFFSFELSGKHYFVTFD